MRLLTFLGVLLCALCANAFAAADPAYRTVMAGQAPRWEDGLILELAADEAKCKGRYGRRWREKCAASFGRSGDIVRNIKLLPPVPGYWQWRDGATLNFVPEKGHSLMPGAKYAIDLEKLYCPAGVILDNKQIALTTLPVAARLNAGKFWTDPSPAKAHRLAAAIEFNYPQAKDPDIEFIASRGLGTGKAEYVWNAARDQLNISWPVNVLPESASRVTLLTRGVGQYDVKDGQISFYPPDAQKNAVVFGIDIPGSRDLFAVKSAKIRPEYNKNIDRVQVLELETTLYAKPAQILKRLHVWQLPKYNSAGADRPYNWLLAPAVSSEILKKSKKLKPVPLQKDDVPISKMSFHVPADAGSYLLLALEEGCQAASGPTLAKPFSTVVKTDDFNPTLGFLQPGHVLPLTDNTVIDIHSSGLEQIRWQVQKVREPFLALLAGNGGEAFTADFPSNGLDFSQVSSSGAGLIKLAENGAGGAQFSTLDLASLTRELDAGQISGLLRISLTGLKDGKETAWASRLLLVTDIGLLAKRARDGRLECFVHGLKDGRPLRNVKLNILGANGMPVDEAISDEFGHAVLRPAGAQPEKRPVAIAATHNGSLAWLPLLDHSRELNYSDFPVGGAHVSENGLNVSVFSQRGLYRPGETLHFGCLTRQGDFALMPEDLPLDADLSDPLGRTIFTKAFAAGKNGLATIEWAVPLNAASGRYTLNIRPRGSREILGFYSVRVEEFQPDTLKLHIGLPKIKGWLKTEGESSKITLNLRNLYGTPAQKHKVGLSLLTAPANFRFAGFEDYVFTDAAPLANHGARMELPSAITDEDGNAIFELPANLAANVSSRINLLAEGFEAGGGRATVAEAAFIASPMEAMLGYRPLGGLTNLQFIPRGEKAEVRFLAVDHELQPVALKNLSFAIANRRHVTSLISDGAGGYRYDETPLDIPVSVTKGSVPQKGLTFPLPSSEPGEFMLDVRDAQNRLLSRIPFSVAGNRPLPPDSPLGIGKMRARLDKNDYRAGEQINLSLALPYDGVGLISIERDGVEAFKWFKAKAGDFSSSIAIPAEFEGRGYVCVTFARSNDSDNIYMTPLAYAVMPFSANVEKRDMGLKLTAPKEVAPDTTLKVEISAREPGQAIVFAVDEGVLQLSNFQNPNPAHDLLLNRALDVKTIQALDLLMPDHAKIGRRLSAFGGGLDGAPFGARFQNPFRRRNEPPVAFWSGIVEVGESPASIEIPIPDYYNGKLRLMAAGSAVSGVGHAVSGAIVVAPLVLTPQMPLAVSPGDRFTGALVLANTTGSELALDLSAEVSPGLAITEKLPEHIKLPPKSEKIIPLPVLVEDLPGESSVTFTARAGAKSWSRRASLSVRPNTPLLTTVQAGRTARTVEIPVNREIYGQLAHGDMLVSAMPMPLAKGFQTYLDTYPHGCTEQLISKAFARVLLKNWPGFNEDAKNRDELIEAALGAIRTRFNGLGVALWPEGEADRLLTIYAADFLLALRENGFGCPEDLLERICDSVANNCALNEPGLAGARKAAYAVWVLTRQGRITTQLLENLLAGLNGESFAGWRNDITAFLIAASQREMHMQNPLPIAGASYQAEGWFDKYALISMQVALLARYLPDACSTELRDACFDAAAMAMNQNRYATFSAAMGIRALMALNEGMALTAAGTRLACMDGTGREIVLGDGSLLGLETALCSKYRLEVPDGSPELFWRIATTGFNRAPMQKTEHGLRVKRSYLDREGNELERVGLGEEITVKITARAMQASLPDCVITDLLPGGFEMVTPRSNSPESQLPRGVKFADRREDRMLLFVDLTDQPLEFSYKIRATNCGLFQTAPVSGQAMYNPDLYGYGESSGISVQDNKTENQ